MVYEIRGQKVMLDFDLARIYGYTTKAFNQQVKNNIEKFPEGFMFRLNNDELGKVLRSQIVTLKNSMIESEENSWSEKLTLKNNAIESEENSWCQNVALNKSGGKRGYNIKYLPYAFTEQGIYMLMTVLRGELAVKQSKALIRLFKRMKDYIVESNNLLTTRDILELSNQVHMNTKSIESLKRKDAALDKKLTKVMDNFIDPSTYKQYVFLSGEKLEADIAYQSIYSQAKKSIHIIDDYIDVKTLYLLRVIDKSIEITIFSDNKAKNYLTKQFMQDFTNQCLNKLELLKTNNKCHDRFIIIDYKEDSEKVFICGSSSKDTGKRATTINQVGNSYLYHPLVETLLNNDELTLL